MTFFSLLEACFYEPKFNHWPRFIEAGDALLLAATKKLKQELANKKLVAGPDELLPVVMTLLGQQASVAKERAASLFERSNTDMPFYYRLSKSASDKFFDDVDHQMMQLEKPLQVLVLIRSFFLPVENTEFASELEHNAYKSLYALKSLLGAAKLKPGFFCDPAEVKFKAILLLCEVYINMKQDKRVEGFPGFKNGYKELFKQLDKQLSFKHRFMKNKLNHLYRLINEMSKPSPIKEKTITKDLSAHPSF